MILQRLVELYDRLERDEQSELPSYGFGPQKISFAIVLEPDGSLYSVDDLREIEGGKPRPRRVADLPASTGRTAAIKAQFLWDRPDYLLGWNRSGADEQKSRQRFAASRELHCSLLHACESPVGRAVAEFFRRWDPSLLPNPAAKTLAEMETAFGIFALRGVAAWAHTEPELRAVWSSYSRAQESEECGICLVTGRKGPTARLHGSIKGVQGAQSAGASIVSFNLAAFNSRGHAQGANAPIGVDASFKFTITLNRLLEFGSGRRIRFGDSTVVFWAEEAQNVSGVEVESIFGWTFEGNPGEDSDRARHVGRVLQDLVTGRVAVPKDGTKFFVLGLSPNAARLAVRFWFEGSVEAVLGRIVRFQRELTIGHSSRDSDQIPLWKVLRQTGREAKDVPPLLAGALTRSVLSGGSFPAAMASAVIRRIRADRDVNHVRAAIIKAYLMRNYGMEVSTMLDPERPESGYQLGRLFACLEKAQEDALGGINATIKDRYYSGASATPGSVFPRLLRLNQHHVRKLEGGKKVVAERRVQEVLGRVDHFPRVLNLEGQGLFALGYYHQRLDFFTKKPTADVPGSADSVR